MFLASADLHTADIRSSAAEARSSALPLPGINSYQIELSHLETFHLITADAQAARGSHTSLSSTGRDYVIGDLWCHKLSSASLYL